MKNKADKLQIAMNLIHDIFNLGINIFENDEDVEKFCEDNRAIDGQAWLSKDALKLILEKGHYDNLNYFEDLLHIRIVLFYYNEIPIIVGPYLSEEMTIGQSIQLCNQIDKKKMDANELLIYYGKYPVIPEAVMDKIIRGITRNLGITNLTEHFTKYKGHTVEDSNDVDLERISNANIEAHYITEREYMDSIKRGNIQETLHYKKLLSENAAGMWTRNVGLQEKKFGLAVNRAMSRIAAYEAGVPAPIIHKITTKESMAISAAQSEKQMEEACEIMLKEFCEIIRIIKNEKYSALTQSIIYSINQHYMHDVSIREIAEELNITESYMISQFKKETGMTPAIYLRQVRLKQAAHLLISTNDEIQKISGSVGIPDANYFVKLFKAEFEMTPGAYRKRYKI
ncbi:AraC-type DNA-binding protein [Pseudobutyrivibrio sp. ACV-2]|uniref:helix-turn-helix transcriptional regulator n=1 Tax=Pseudobutyrivibrio sp. ACV-2 TaxID=1520801 RepID=UPI000898514E|nr:helix-turn-helix domain-containing protein [Pseudobutyrivibrio sp. ACV-2]SEA95106.1 AraC-type DNA-binding protein [Pseudobutyrivibrio sp. ACV-2]